MWRDRYAVATMLNAFVVILISIIPNLTNVQVFNLRHAGLEIVAISRPMDPIECPVSKTTVYCESFVPRLDTSLKRAAIQIGRKSKVIESGGRPSGLLAAGGQGGFAGLRVFNHPAVGLTFFNGIRLYDIHLDKSVHVKCGLPARVLIEQNDCKRFRNFRHFVQSYIGWADPSSPRCNKGFVRSFCAQFLSGGSVAQSFSLKASSSSLLTKHAKLICCGLIPTDPGIFHFTQLAAQNQELQDRNEEKQSGEDGNGAGPSHHIAVQLIGLVFGAAFSVLGAWSAIFWRYRRGWLLICGLSLGASVALAYACVPVILSF
jgi:hypothetical protein